MMFRFVLIFLFIFFTGILAAQKKKEVEMTYFHMIPFEELYKAGDKLRFMQLCSTETDSIVNGTIIFRAASVSTVDSCKMSMRIITDTIRSYQVETFTEKNTEHLLDITMGRYGKPTGVFAKGHRTTYNWKEPSGNRWITTLLVINEKRHRGVLKSVFE